MNKVWPILIILGLFISLLTGNIEKMGNVIINSATNAFELFIKVAILLLFWSGLFQIAIDSGMVNRFAKKIKKPLEFLFPDLNKDSKAFDLIAANMVANILGLGSAATPLGLKAFQAMKEEAEDKTVASRSMITLVAINCSSITLLPTTIISLRTVYGGTTSISVIVLMIIATCISTTIALLLDRLFYHLEQRK